MGAPLISVIMPVYNSEAFLDEAIESVLNQSLRDIELICVDDGSTDGSPTLMNAWAAKDDRVIVLRQKNQFAGTARNTGMDQAQGTFIAFLDADDYYLPHCLETLYAKAAENDLDLVKCAATCLNMQTREFYSTPTLKNALVSLHNEVLSMQSGGTAVLGGSDVPWNGLYRAAFIRENGIRFNNMRCSNDRSFFIGCVCYAQRVMFIDDAPIIHRTYMNDSLIGIRHNHFDCVTANYALAKAYAEKARLSEEQKGIILKKEFAAVLHWYALLQERKLNLPQIEEHLLAFFRTVDPQERDRWIAGLPQNKALCERMLRRMDTVYAAAPVEAPGISIVMPVYNMAQYLTECIDSVMCQSYRDFELICVDDGSDDESPAILEHYAARDARVIFLRQDHQKAGPARNLAMSVARGEYLTFLDADDTFAPEHLATVMAHCREHDLDAYLTQRTFCYDQGSFVPLRRIVRDNKIPEGVFGWKDVLPCIFNFVDGAPGGKTLRRSFIRRHGLQYPSMARCHDVPFIYAALARADRMMFDKNEAGYLYRKTNTGSLQATIDQTPLAFDEAYQCLVDNLRVLPYFPELKQSLTNLHMQMIVHNLSMMQTTEGFAVVYEFIRDVAARELELDLHEDDWYYDPALLDTIRKIVVSPRLADYLFVRSADQARELNDLRSSASRFQGYKRELDEQRGKMRRLYANYQELKEREGGLREEHQALKERNAGLWKSYQELKEKRERLWESYQAQKKFITALQSAAEAPKDDPQENAAPPQPAAQPAEEKK